MVTRVYIPFDKIRDCDWCGKAISDTTCFSTDDIPNSTDSYDFCCLKCLSAFGKHFPQYQPLLSDLFDKEETEEESDQ